MSLFLSPEAVTAINPFMYSSFHQTYHLHSRCPGHHNDISASCCIDGIHPPQDTCFVHQHQKVEHQETEDQKEVKVKVELILEISDAKLEPTNLDIPDLSCVQRIIIVHSASTAKVTTAPNKNSNIEWEHVVPVPSFQLSTEQFNGMFSLHAGNVDSVSASLPNKHENSDQPREARAKVVQDLRGLEHWHCSEYRHTATVLWEKGAPN